MKRFSIILIAVLFAAVCGAVLLGCDNSQPSKLAAPENLRVYGSKIVWDEVDGAEDYIVEVNDAEFDAPLNEFDISKYLRLDEKKTYIFRVMAVRTKPRIVLSDWSEELEIALPIYEIYDNSGKTEISPRWTDNYITDFFIPAKFAGVSVDSVKVRNSYNITINSIVIEEGISEIKKEAFRNFYNLTKAVIPSTVTEIAGDAFSGCSKLTELIVDEDNKAFKSDGNCIIRKSDNMLIAACENSVVPDYISGIGDYVFHYDSITEFVIPSNVKTIGRYAFASSNLNSIVIPSNVEKMGYYAFSNCKNLEYITFSDGVTAIDEDVFLDLYNLKRITIPQSVVSIAESAFKYTSSKYLKLFNCSVTFSDDFAGGCIFLWFYIYVPESAKICSQAIPCTVAYDGCYPYVHSLMPHKVKQVISTRLYGFALPAREGYEFVGWATEEGGEAVIPNTLIDYKGVVYPRTMCRQDYVGITEDTVWYAVWEKTE